MKNYIKIGLLTLSSLFIMSVFTGCGALTTAIEKRNLDVQTKMSDSIFLEPVELEKQIVYVRVRNTTDKNINIEDDIKQAFKNKGFKVTLHPSKAEFMVQANLLQIGKSDKKSATRALESGFGGALLGAGAVALGGSRSTSSYAAGGIIGGLIGTVTDALVKDVYYTMVTDVEIRQRASADEIIYQNSNGSSKQGMSSNLNQNIEKKHAKWKIYRTRIVSTANKMNLEFEEAKPKLIEGLTRSISGVL
ncbi:conjugal transfer protein TraT [Malaciobacter molluscorum LMG 25693]|uniref:Complement resistance protein TraT n=1 Tax=Malaciobacter molluscorum LMG 25693 TaxID=870501 RepID=A0A2G1DEZ4_9BACT|nr:complement resistance protein TraT [Malaciobacter molluscorum]AXX91241.1 complement resistance protein TraT [Malaciobacter molluscorum LMG 25693]PHO17082.1 conjugal transfer protein TraT [Malaciobacter molluscorum LMG 25693]